MEEWKSNVEFLMLNVELPLFKPKKVFLSFLKISCNSWFWRMISERITWKKSKFRITKKSHSLVTIYYSLISNPCFNGRCKRTKSTHSNGRLKVVVSILVLMEDVKEHCQLVKKCFSWWLVSILVLMEDVKEPHELVG